MFDLEAITNALAPELLLAAFGLFGVLAGAVLRDGFNRPSFSLGAIVLFVAAGLSIVNWQGARAFGDLVYTTPFVNFAKTVSYAAAGLALLMADGFLRRHDTQRYEYALLVVFASLGWGSSCLRPT